MIEPSLDPVAVITLLGAVQGILLALALFSLKGGQTANRLLAAFMVVTSLVMMGSMLTSTRYILIYPHFAQLATPFQFLFGPLIYLYIRTSTSGKSLRRRDLLHAVPFLVCAAYYAPLYYQSGAYKLSYLEASLQNYPPKELVIKSLLLLVQALPYLIVTVSIFLSHSRAIKGLNSTIEKRRLFWLRTFIGMLLVVTTVGVFRLFFNLRVESMLLIPLVFSVVVYVAGYMALKHPEALVGVAGRASLDHSILGAAGAEVSGPPAKKYEKSNLTPERADEYLKRLLEFMETAKPYTNGDLTLKGLAGELQISASHLSQIINELLGQNFFDFVNAYRVKEVQRLFADPSKNHYSLLAIAEEVGFNSKSTFNSVFKKHVNMTPSEFRRVRDEIGQSQGESLNS